MKTSIMTKQEIMECCDTIVTKEDKILCYIGSKIAYIFGFIYKDGYGNDLYAQEN